LFGKVRGSNYTPDLPYIASAVSIEIVALSQVVDKSLSIYLFPYDNIGFSVLLPNLLVWQKQGQAQLEQPT
jgi:hypothetical protein